MRRTVRLIAVPVAVLSVLSAVTSGAPAASSAPATSGAVVKAHPPKCC